MRRSAPLTLKRILWLLTALALRGHAAPPPFVSPFVQFNQQDGVSHSLINCVYQDHKNFLWIGTMNGLNRYDGFSFKRYKPGRHRATSLLSGEVKSVYQDTRHRLWIRYSGVGFSVFDPVYDQLQHFLHVPHDSSTISADYVSFNPSSTDVVEDCDSTVWVRTVNGLNRYRETDDSFVRYYLGEAEGASAGSNEIMVMKVDDRCRLWVGTQRGLYVREPGTDSFRWVPLPGPGRAPAITAIAQRANGQLWVGTTEGLFFTPDAPQTHFARLTYDDRGAKAGRRMVRCITEDLTQCVWVGTNLGTLRIIAPADTADYRVTYGLSTDAYAPNGQLLIDQILVDSQGQVWIRSNPAGAGLYRYLPRTDQYQEVRLRPHSDSLDRPRVSCLYEDDKNVLWIGTWKEGIYRANLNAKPFHHAQVQPTRNSRANDIHAIRLIDSTLYLGTSLGLYQADHHRFRRLRLEQPGTDISTLETDGRHLWIGTFDHKITRLDLLRGRVQQWDESFPAWSVRDIHSAADGNTWIATASSGLVRHRAATDSFAFFPLDTLRADVLNNWVNVVVAKGRYLWLGTKKSGLLRFDTKRERLEYFPTGNTVLRDINALYRQNDSLLWLGTALGLACVNLYDSTVFRLDEQDGLADNYVSGILPDDHRNLWLSTYNGLSKMSLSTHRFTNYTVSDGLPANEFNPGACYRSPDGTLYFGGVNGLTYFRPEKIKPDNHPATVHIATLAIRGRPVSVGDTVSGQVPLRRSLIFKDALSLAHRNNAITLSFVALHFGAPEKIKFRYRLLGFDTTWLAAPAQVRQATYTNLPPGRYTFEVKASNPDGTFFPASADTMLIVIHPPWWDTTAFRLILAVLVTAAAYGFYWRRTQRLRAQKQALQQEVAERTEQLSRKTDALTAANRQLEEQREGILQATVIHRELAERVHQADLAKIRFLTNVSHEIRTPLTLILGPLADLGRLIKKSKEAERALAVMQRNAQQLLKLVNQLLNLSKIESNTQPLRLVEGDLLRFIRQQLPAFHYLARSKEISFMVDAVPGPRVAFFDEDVVEKVLNNLLSNAFKFTPAGGQVTLRIRPQQHYTTFELSDTGPGIPEADLDKVFDYYYQSSLAQPSGTGTGIGLALARHLIRRHGGTIEVVSPRQGGAQFNFTLRTFAHDEDGAYLPSPPAAPLLKPAAEQLLPVATSSLETAVQGQTILIVDDHPDMRLFLKNMLAGANQILEAENGKVALRTVERQPVDFIISDVMMPEMDGVTLCRTLKQNQAHSDIPLILLTARADEAGELLGLQVGAEDYVTKPFDRRVLLLRMRKILRVRARVRQQLQGNSPTYDALPVKKVDQDFLQRLDHIVEEQLAQPDLNGDTLADLFIMSKGHLYRKVKSLTGCSVHQYIANRRLKKAARLIREGESIAQAAYAVGFDNPSYFSRSFSKLFGVPPSKYGVPS